MGDCLPNFIIVGAAKSGTTSLYQYLKQHPDVYLPVIKECKFFSDMKTNYKGPGDEVDLNNQIIKEFTAYRSLFSGVDNEIAVGDVSPDYLYYYVQSIRNINRVLGKNVKIIIILRNPVERAYSKYLHNVRECFETLSFEDALNEENERKRKNWGWGWYYVSTGFYSQQVKAYIDNFNQVKVFLYEDLENNPLDLMKNICEFLETDSSFKLDMSVKFNVSGVPKNKLLNNILVKPNIFKTVTKFLSKSFLANERMGKIKEFLRSQNLEKPEIKSETRKYLYSIYREDILKLQNMINRDLSHWLV